jgi:hypothetical protein
VLIFCNLRVCSFKDANRAHARLRGPGERANAQLKHWRVLRKLRCCPRRAGQLAKALTGWAGLRPVTWGAWLGL